MTANTININREAGGGCATTDLAVLPMPKDETEKLPENETKRYYWLKLSNEFFDEKYVKALRRLPYGDSLVIIFLKMQLKSLKTEGFIKYDGIMPDAISELALMIDEDTQKVQLTVDALIRFGVAEWWDDNIFYISSVQKLIGSEMQSAERMRKHRNMRNSARVTFELPASDLKASQCDANLSQCDAFLSQCDTEIEIEKETEKETETEKEREVESESEKETEEEREVEEEKEKEKEKEVEVEERERYCYQRIADIYNDTCVSFPRLIKMTNKRRQILKARLTSGYTIEQFRKCFETVEKSSFLKGSNKQNWIASFDWIVQDNNMTKILEGNYSDKEEKSVANPYKDLKGVGLIL